MIMTMAIVSSFQKIDAAHVTESLQAIRERLDAAEGETILDFSSIQRIDSPALGMMEELAGLADARSATITLRGVNVHVYKVLKLVRLAPRFLFLN
jgi:anti-anti-sigma regulatory factor